MMSYAGGGQLPPPQSLLPPPSPQPPKFDVDPELADNEVWEEAAQAATIEAFDAAAAEETRLSQREEMDERRRAPNEPELRWSAHDCTSRTH
jgi:hypothetical protein